MIGLVATLRVKDGQAEAFEDVFREIMALVRLEEPGTLVYQLTKSRADASLYKVLELYQDLAALNAHGTSEAVRAAFSRMGDCLQGRAEVEYLDAVV